MVAEVPLGIIAVKVVLGEGRSGVTCRVEADARVDALFSRDDLRHDTEGTVGELLNAPELFVGSSVFRNGLHFAVCCSSQCTLSSLNGNLEIGVAKICALALNGCDGPALVGTEHIVTDTSRDVALWPRAFDLIQRLVSHGLWGSGVLLRTAKATETTCTGYVHTNKVDSQLEGIATTLALNLEGTALELLASRSSRAADG